MPKVSVIIPAYNAMTFLPITLEGVLKQTFQDFEVLIINDGSSDHIEQWGKEILDQRVTLISQKNQGPAIARNTGLAHAKGEYFAFLDADDLWADTKLEKQVSVLDNNPDIGLVYSWVGSIDHQGNIRGKLLKNNVEGDVWSVLIQHNIIECGSNPMVRHICFEKAGNFDPQLPYAQEWDMWLRIAADYPFKVIKEPLTYYRDHANNRSKKWQRMEQSYQIIMDKAFSHVSPEREVLKNRAYGYSKLRIAWKILQTLTGDYQTPLIYQKQAKELCPELQNSSEYRRLTIAIFLVRFLGVQGYKNARYLIDQYKKLVSLNSQ